MFCRIGEKKTRHTHNSTQPRFFRPVALLQPHTKLFQALPRDLRVSGAFGAKVYPIVTPPARVQHAQPVWLPEDILSGFLTVPRDTVRP